MTPLFNRDVLRIVAQLENAGWQHSAIRSGTLCPNCGGMTVARGQCWFWVNWPRHGRRYSCADLTAAASVPGSQLALAIQDDLRFSQIALASEKAAFAHGRPALPMPGWRRLAMAIRSGIAQLEARRG